MDTVHQPSRRGISASTVMTSGSRLAGVPQHLEGGLAVAGLDHLIALELQVDPDQVPDLLGVVDHEDSPAATCPVGGRQISRVVA